MIIDYVYLLIFALFILTIYKVAKIENKWGIILYAGTIIICLIKIITGGKRYEQASLW